MAPSWFEAAISGGPAPGDSLLGFVSLCLLASLCAWGVGRRGWGDLECAILWGRDSRCAGSWTTCLGVLLTGALVASGEALPAFLGMAWSGCWWGGMAEGRGLWVLGASLRVMGL